MSKKNLISNSYEIELIAKYILRHDLVFSAIFIF